MTDDLPEIKGPSTSAGRKPGPYKTFEEKGERAQFLAAADVLNRHEAGAILQSAPKAASILGQAEHATALRLMAKDPAVHPANALKGMKGTSMYNVLYSNFLIKKHSPATTTLLRAPFIWPLGYC